MTSRSVIAILALAFGLTSGCMQDEGRSDSVPTGTQVESLHPAGMGSIVSGTVDSQCTSACNMLSDCGYLEGLTFSQCVAGCEEGAFNTACILSAADCYEVSYCFY